MDETYLNFGILINLEKIQAFSKRPLALMD